MGSSANSKVLRKWHGDWLAMSLEVQFSPFCAKTFQNILMHPPGLWAVLSANHQVRQNKVGSMVDSNYHCVAYPMGRN